MNGNLFVRICCRAYSWLLLLYPYTFRRDYGAQSVQLFRDVCRDAHRSSGLRGLLVICSRTAVDLLHSLPREHAAHLREDTMAFFNRLVGLKVSTDSWDRKMAKAVYLACAPLTSALFIWKLTRLGCSDTEMALGIAVALFSSLIFIVLALELHRLRLPVSARELFTLRGILQWSCYTLAPATAIFLIWRAVNGNALSEAYLTIGVLFSLVLWQGFSLLGISLSVKPPDSAMQRN
jgi:hypothetical protein